MLKIYIASPYSTGDKTHNVMRQRIIAGRLIRLGYCPIAQLLGHYVDHIEPMPYEAWMAVDMEMIRVCDGLLRLSGVSPGADREVEFARSLGKPVLFVEDEINLPLFDMREAQERSLRPCPDDCRNKRGPYCAAGGSCIRIAEDLYETKSSAEKEEA